MGKMLEVNLCGIKMRNPTVLASGVMGLSKGTLKRVADEGAGAVTIKSISPKPREGHPNPTIIGFEAGLMNAVGYSNAGIEQAKVEFTDLKQVGVPVIGSALGKNADEFAQVVAEMDKMEFDAIELPLSCPHTPGYGTMAGHGSCEAVGEIVSAARKETKKPLFAKISPLVGEITEVAKEAEKAGADAITAVNSLGPGMIIDINTAKPIMGFKIGGICGPAIRPVAVKCVYDIYESVKIPVIGTGGVTTGRDAIEMILAGATAVGIGSAIYYRELDVFRKICFEMEWWMKKMGYKNLKELRGKAHG